MESWSDPEALQVWPAAGAKYVFTKYPASAGLVLEVNGTNGGTDIWQQAGSGSSTQANEVWTYEPQPSGYAWLVNDANGQCLEVNGTTGAVDTWPCVDGAPNELWAMTDNWPDPANGQNAAGIDLQVASSGENLGTAATGQSLSNGSALAMYSGSGDQVSWTATQVG
ncbi:MAG TPA: RICIN domain-containing protein [Trebonia sp.]|nr:RICIN domain-containing protein [Trebonia sp.]